MRLRDAGEMLEYAQVFDNYYATSRSQVEKHLADHRNVVLEIDWQGARQVRESMPDCVTIFILPPSLAELERRLRDRRTDRPEVIERRLRTPAATCRTGRNSTTSSSMTTSTMRSRRWRPCCRVRVKHPRHAIPSCAARFSESSARTFITFGYMGSR